jgi:glucose/mannose-6-phosphate isomerase
MNLESREEMGSLDTSRMCDHLERFPAQLREAAEAGRSTPISVEGHDLTSVVVVGMGGSAIGGELAAGYLADSLAVPLVVVRNYGLPAYVGQRTLVFVSSYSGNTEETLSCYAEARERGARVVCSTTGGEVGRLAAEHGHDTIALPAGYPPRAALGFGFAPLLFLLARLGLAPDPSADVEDAARVCEQGVGRLGLDVLEGSNEAKQIASWFRGHTPAVYGSAPATSVVASRWCGQLSENAKVVGHRNELPEMDHNEIVGWSGAVSFGGGARVVFLRDSDDHPRVARRADFTRDAIARSGAEVRDVVSVGGTRLGRLLSLVQVGDFASYYLALLGGVDPTPVVPIDELKRELAKG